MFKTYYYKETTMYSLRCYYPIENTYLRNTLLYELCSCHARDLNSLGVFNTMKMSAIKDILPKEKIVNQIHLANVQMRALLL